MVDMFPFPRVVGDTSEQQISELVNYLIQFKETLEFALANISTENLSTDLVNKLNELGADIEQSKANREEEVTQLSQNTTLTISDVVNSAIFENAVKGEVSALTFSVNFETGNLEYTI